MTEKQLADLVKLIAIEVAEHYFGLQKEYVSKEMTLHVAQCAAQKYGWLKSLGSAVLGGVIVGVLLWKLKG